ncbi:MAG: cysteine desulfurase family protein [Patescibacteria group bacterium]
MSKGFLLGFFRSKRVFLDHAAGTPVAPEVLRAMIPHLKVGAGNPSSIHKEGVEAKGVLEAARGSVARMVGAHVDEIVFTSGGTESNNLAIEGVLRSEAALRHGRHVVTTAFEHHSVKRVLLEFEKEGWEVSWVMPDDKGLIDPRAIFAAIRPDTVLVSVIGGHNEVGTIQPLSTIAKAIRKARTGAFPYFHTDACQLAGAVPFSVVSSGVDLASFNSHKMYGPSGAGALFVRRSVALRPVILGGGQEKGVRAGTENLPSLFGFAAACELFREEGAVREKRMTRLRDQAIEKLLTIEGSHLVGDRADRLPGHISISFAGVEAEQLVIELDRVGIAVSSGSACSTGENTASYAILALRKSEEEAKGTLRITLGRETRKGDLDRLMRALPPILKKLRRFS